MNGRESNDTGDRVAFVCGGPHLKAHVLKGTNIGDIGWTKIKLMFQLSLSHRPPD